MDEKRTDQPTTPEVARADRQDGHYEADKDQLVKVVHQEKPARMPTQGPTDFERRGRTHDTATEDVAVTPSSTSVWEATPPDDEQA